ncbi:MAG: tetratricopeptide repeat protein [Flavobacterium sp.]|nr:MAG: tetratricopeptide repeat protein [Flavobacterium sp.]
MLRFLGERLIEFRKYQAVIVVYQLAISENPGFTAGYYSIGKAYEKSGQISEAIKAYQQAVDRFVPNIRANVFNPSENIFEDGLIADLAFGELERLPLMPDQELVVNAMVKFSDM